MAELKHNNKAFLFENNKFTHKIDIVEHLSAEEVLKFEIDLVNKIKELDNQINQLDNIREDLLSSFKQYQEGFRLARLNCDNEILEELGLVKQTISKEKIPPMEIFKEMKDKIQNKK